MTTILEAPLSEQLNPNPSDAVALSTDYFVRLNTLATFMSRNIALDTLNAPSDTTALNATSLAHGLLPKLSGSATDVLVGSGAWVSTGVFTIDDGQLAGSWRVVADTTARDAILGGRKKVGMRVFVVSLLEEQWWNGSAWVTVTGGSGGPSGPGVAIDCGTYTNSIASIDCGVYA